ncbi:hypothetical protein MEX01_43560 [Methylorubrum extorquens]|nr:hypothetical protein MEX01_43560 [Methylorubrum extorquens]
MFNHRNSLLNDHLPGPATAPWGTFRCLDGPGDAPNVGQSFGLIDGLWFRLMRFRNDEARQDATWFLSGFGRSLRDSRSGIKRRPQCGGPCSTRPSVRFSWLLGRNGDVTCLSTRLGFDGERPPNAIALHIGPDGWK